MHWYWILLIVFGYFVIGSIVVGLVKRTDNEHVFDDDSDELLILIDILWPISLVVFILISIYCLVAYRGKKHVAKIESKNKINEL